jgi:hypothetical protein
MNKLFITLLIALSANMAQAEFTAQCKLIGGAERALVKAPDEIEISEAGEFFVTIAKDNKSQSFSTEEGNLVDLSKGSQIRLKSLSSVKGLTLAGIYSLNLYDCDQVKPARGLFTWKIEEMDMMQNNGNAFYDCTCTED